MFSDVVDSINIISRSARFYSDIFDFDEWNTPDERLLDHIRIGIDMRRAFLKQLEERNDQLFDELVRLKEKSQAELNYWENTLERLEGDSGEIRAFRRREIERAIELARKDCERNLLEV